MSDREVEWDWDRRHGLGWDLTELILSKLPLRSMVRASAVCRAWRRVLLHLPFEQPHPQRRPWLFLHGHNNVVPRLGRAAFAYDPSDSDSCSWVSFSLPADCFAGAGGFAFASPAPSRLAFAPLLRGGDDAFDWSHAPPLGSSRCGPVVAALPSLFVVAGGARSVGGLVDIEDERGLPTELYHRGAGASRWEQCAPLPAELQLGTAGSLSSALLLLGAGGDPFLFVYGGAYLSAFDVSRRAWTPARELRPAPGLAAAFLASGRGGRRLLLAGVVEDGGAFGVWDVDPDTLAARKIGEMPPELQQLLLPPGTSVRCVGQDGLLYVLSDDQHRAYPACACEVLGGELRCRWTRLPPLPVAGSSALSRFHKMVAFCSPVLLRHHLAGF